MAVLTEIRILLTGASILLDVHAGGVM